MHPIQIEMMATQRHDEDVRRARHIPTWEIAELDAHARRGGRRTWLRRNPVTRTRPAG